MCEFVSGPFYLPKLVGPTVENTFCSSKKLAVSERICFQKIQDGIFEQLGGKFVNFDNFFLTLS